MMINEEKNGKIKKIEYKQNKIYIFLFVFIIINIFFLCGCNSIDNNKSDQQQNNNIKEYSLRYANAESNSFIKAGEMHNKRTMATMLLLPDDNVLISGGNNNLNSFEIFNTQTGIFKEIKLPAKYESYRNSLILEDNLVLINDSFIYDYKTGNYINIFNKDYFNVDSFSFKYSENEVIIVEQNTGYIYNYKQNTMRTIQIDFPSIGHKNYIIVDQDNVIVYGINKNNKELSSYWTTDIYLWNIKKNIFHKFSMDNISSNATIIKTNDDELIIFSEKYKGQTENNIGNKEQITIKINIKSNKVNNLYNPEINRKVPPLAISLSDGNIFLIGGENSEYKGTMFAEVYDPLLDKYSAIANTQSLYIPAISYYRPAILELKNTDILICGGIYESNIQDKCLILKRSK